MLAGASGASLAARGEQAGTTSGSRCQGAARGSRAAAYAVRRPHRQSPSAQPAEASGRSREGRSCVPLQHMSVHGFRRRGSSVVFAGARAMVGGEHSESEAPASSAPEPVGIFNFPQRWILVAATSLAFVLCNMDKVRRLGRARSRLGDHVRLSGDGQTCWAAHGVRCMSASPRVPLYYHFANPSPASTQVNMSVALIPMAKDFGWSGADKGLVRYVPAEPCARRKPDMVSWVAQSG